VPIATACLAISQKPRSLVLVNELGVDSRSIDIHAIQFLDQCSGFGGRLGLDYSRGRVAAEKRDLLDLASGAKLVKPLPVSCRIRKMPCHQELRLDGSGFL